MTFELKGADEKMRRSERLPDDGDALLGVADAVAFGGFGQGRVAAQTAQTEPLLGRDAGADVGVGQRVAQPGQAVAAVLVQARRFLVLPIGCWATAKYKRRLQLERYNHDGHTSAYLLLRVCAVRPVSAAWPC